MKYLKTLAIFEQIDKEKLKYKVIFNKYKKLLDSGATENELLEFKQKYYSKFDEDLDMLDMPYYPSDDFTSYLVNNLGASLLYSESKDYELYTTINYDNLEIEIFEKHGDGNPIETIYISTHFFKKYTFRQVYDWLQSNYTAELTNVFERWYEEY